jgi:diguanylate cyclase (GGDEF)-like protein
MSVLDAEFVAELAPEKLWNSRIAFTMAAVLYGLFGIIDSWMIPSALHAVWMIRTVVVAVSVLALALTWSEQFLRDYQKYALFIPILWATGIEGMLYLAAPGDPARAVYYTGLILVVIGFHNFFYLPITLMIGVSAGIVALYASIALAAHDMARTGELPTLVANLFFLVSSVIICGTSQARRYRYLVENLYWRRTLANDVATKEQARRQSEHRASHDLLTGLPNRRHFIDLVDHSIEEARRQGTRGALMFIDLDGFKPINDTHGHAVGDEVLQILARRMHSCLRQPGAVARLAGDEFGAVVTLSSGTSDNAARVADRMLKAISQPIVLGPLQVVVTASFGVALFPCHGTDAETLMSIADRCMYEVKRNGKAGIGVARVDASRC